MEKYTQKQLKIIKEYEELLKDPMADGYTYKAFEDKYKVDSDEVDKMYEKYKNENRVNLTKEQAINLIIEEVNIYKEKSRFNCAIFPKEEIINILDNIRE